MTARTPALLLATLFAVASCTATSPTPTTPAPEALPSNGAPKVAHPLDVGEFEDDPCTALTGEQAEELGVPDATATDEVHGRGCHWTGPASGGPRVDVYFYSDVGRGLSQIYEESENLTFFEVLPAIEGFPAVALNAAMPPGAVCSVDVGVSDPLAVEVTAWQFDDPCASAATIAATMLRTMRQG